MPTRQAGSVARVRLGVGICLIRTFVPNKAPKRGRLRCVDSDLRATTSSGVYTSPICYETYLRLSHVSFPRFQGRGPWRLKTILHRNGGECHIYRRYGPGCMGAHPSSVVAYVFVFSVPDCFVPDAFPENVHLHEHEGASPRSAELKAGRNIQSQSPPVVAPAR